MKTTMDQCLFLTLSNIHHEFNTFPMKKNLFLFSILALISLSGCSQSNSSINKESTSDWKKLNCGLFLSPTGELGFASEPEIANIPSSELKSERCTNVFLKTLGSDGKVKLSSVIDTSTFEELGASFYKDKHNIYNYYAMCDGGYLHIFAKDTATFKTLGCCYASYKDTIYHSRNGTLKADATTFKTSDEIGPAGKDKNSYFSFENRVSEEELRQEMGDELFEKLKGL